MASKRERIPMVSSLTMAFKRATKVTEDAEEAKLEHRANLRVLVDDYMNKLAKGEVEGIRNAKELVEVIKADMLLMGEATDRTETNTNLDEVRLKEVSSIIDDNDPAIQGLVDELFNRMNLINDDHGDKVRVHGREVDPDDDVVYGVPDDSEELPTGLVDNETTE